MITKHSVREYVTEKPFLLSAALRQVDLREGRETLNEKKREEKSGRREDKIGKTATSRNFSLNQRTKTWYQNNFRYFTVLLIFS